MKIHTFYYPHLASQITSKWKILLLLLRYLYYPTPSFSSAYDPFLSPQPITPLIHHFISPKHTSKFEDCNTKSGCQMKTRQRNYPQHTVDFRCGSKALYRDHIVIVKAIFQSLAGSLHQGCDGITCLIKGSCKTLTHCFCYNNVIAE